MFRNLHYVNQSNACFVFAGTQGDVTIEQVKATNVQRFIEHHPDLDQPNASWELANVTNRSIEVQGYSKGAIRLGKPEPNGKADAHNIFIDQVFGDAERQDGDPFCMGIHLRGDVNHVTIRRTTMNNCQQTRSPDDYWNGDGFTVEAGVSNVFLEDTQAAGHTDAGYDLKASHVTVLRAKASDNKRNFRFWSTIAVQDSIGHEPCCRGGSGCQAQVYAGRGATVTLTHCTFESIHPSTRVFQSEQGGTVTLNGGAI